MESSTHYPGSEDHDEQDLDRPVQTVETLQDLLLIRDPKVLVEVTQTLVRLKDITDAACCFCIRCDRLLLRRRHVYDYNK